MQHITPASGPYCSKNPWRRQARQRTRCGLRVAVHRGKYGRGKIDSKIFAVGSEHDGSCWKDQKTFSPQFQQGVKTARGMFRDIEHPSCFSYVTFHLLGKSAGLLARLMPHGLWLLHVSGLTLGG